MFLLHVGFALECSFLDLCGSGTPRCGAFSVCFPFFEFLEVSLFSMGDILSALCDTVKVSHAHRKNVVRYYKVSHALLEKYRTTLEECRTASWEMSHDTFPISHAFLRSIARHWSSVARSKGEVSPPLVKSIARLLVKTCACQQRALFVVFRSFWELIWIPFWAFF